MNENNNYNNGSITPYKASGNLNTAIGNPTVNINDTMDVNIQSMATNTVSTSYINNNQSPVNNTSIPVNNNLNSNNNINTLTNSNINSIQNNETNNNVTTNSIHNVSNISNQYIQDEQRNNNINKTYVSIDNKPKKKNISLSLGPEFKIGLLIIVILLVFVLFLPMISEFFNGY